MNFGICITIFPFALGTENEDAVEEYQNDNQASWVHRMIMALMSDSTLFNTREGRAGKVHNFMLGLNLNTSYPLSPFRDFNTQESLDEDELDTAVTGRYGSWKLWKPTQEIASFSARGISLIITYPFRLSYRNVRITCVGIQMTGFFWGGREVHWTESNIVLSA